MLYLHSPLFFFTLLPLPTSSTHFFPPSKCSVLWPNDREIMRSEGTEDSRATWVLWKLCVQYQLSLSFSLQARIKAINTFFGKNGFCSIQDSGAYSQRATLQTPYDSPVYVQQMYSPQQQYPVYPLVSPSWNPSGMPYFETPLVRTFNILFRISL